MQYFVIMFHLCIAQNTKNMSKVIAPLVPELIRMISSSHLTLISLSLSPLALHLFISLSLSREEGRGGMRKIIGIKGKGEGSNIDYIASLNAFQQSVGCITLARMRGTGSPPAR